ncbi:hypothetical protein QJS10_CPA09g01066 [Acorus calamus]|uniref:Uncharacterized protein n=1 Tax=Acorus calamus TaxID=4465 RepID=A0AAV9E688_ACOCL|nr:hypothetical protein QJS10_CPA09g01066 [Acorus calamus]
MPSASISRPASLPHSSPLTTASHRSTTSLRRSTTRSSRSSLGRKIKRAVIFLEQDSTPPTKQNENPHSLS